MKIIVCVVITFSILGCAKERREYYPSGKLKAILQYRDDKLNGLEKTFYEDGILETQGTFKEGKKNGEFFHYSGNRKLTLTSMWVNDTMQGITKVFFENGALHYLTPYKDGKKEGSGQEYDSLGHLSADTYYSDDTLRFLNSYDQSGKTISSDQYIAIIADDRIALGQPYKAAIHIEGIYNKINSIEVTVKSRDKEAIILNQSLQPDESGDRVLNFTPHAKGQYEVKILARILNNPIGEEHKLESKIQFEVL